MSLTDDLTLHLDQVALTGKDVHVSSATLTGEQRRKLTLLAEQRGYVVYKRCEDSKGRNPYLVISQQGCGEVCDPSSLSAAQLKVFSDLCNVPLENPATLAADMQLYGVAPGALDDFVHEVQRLGLAGMKRRDRIVNQEIIDALAAHPNYKALHATDGSSTLSLVGEFDDRWTIMKKVYNTNNHGKVFYSIDLKAAIFRCYVDQGIIEGAATWSDFVARFTASKLYAHNKFARVRIFGDLDKTRRHELLWKNAIWKVWQRILAAWPEAKERLVAIENDEIVLRAAESGTATDLAPEITRLLGECGLATLERDGSINFRCYSLTSARVQQPDGKSPGAPFYVREMLNHAGQFSGEFDVKCAQKPTRKQATIQARNLVAERALPSEMQLLLRELRQHASTLLRRIPREHGKRTRTPAHSPVRITTLATLVTTDGADFERTLTCWQDELRVYGLTLGSVDGGDFASVDLQVDCFDRDELDRGQFRLVQFVQEHK